MKKTKKCINKLPDGLPPLPPVPEGYDAWELLGYGGLKGENLPAIPWSSASINGWGSIGTSNVAIGYKDRFYIRAIKHPAPKAAKKQPRAKAVKADVLEGLRYISESPSLEYGGFHPNAITTAKLAIKEIKRMREALALAHAILAKIPPRDLAHAHKRAAIKHDGNDPMAYIAGVLANNFDQPTPAENKKSQ